MEESVVGYDDHAQSLMSPAAADLSQLIKDSQKKISQLRRKLQEEMLSKYLALKEENVPETILLEVKETIRAELIGLIQKTDNTLNAFREDERRQSDAK